MPELLSGLFAFFAYYIGSIGYCAVFCLIYTRLTPHDEFDLIVRQHNASAGLAFAGGLIGFAIALAGAIHNTQSVGEFMVWGFIAMASQILSYQLARLLHPGLSHAIEQNALASGYFAAGVGIAAGIVGAACMSP